eukprot:29037-Pelagococcus_subviridis.AAC.5
MFTYCTFTYYSAALGGSSTRTQPSCSAIDFPDALSRSSSLPAPGCTNSDAMPSFSHSSSTSRPIVGFTTRFTHSTAAPISVKDLYSAGGFPYGFTRKTVFPCDLSRSHSFSTTGFRPWFPTTAQTFFLSISSPVDAAIVVNLATALIDVP